MKPLDTGRRRFLGQAAEGMVWLTAGSLAACGGGGGEGAAGGTGGTGGTGGGGGGTSAVSPEQRLGALEAVRAQVAALAAGGPVFDAGALVASLQSLPAITRAGVAVATSTVWAEFNDGRYLVVPNNLAVAGATGSASSGRKRALGIRRGSGADGTARRLASDGFDKPSLLVGQQYRQLDMFGRVPTSAAVEAAHLCQDFVGADTLPDLRRMAIGLGFTLPPEQSAEPPDAGHDNGLAGLASVGGDGVFFVNACGAQVGPEDRPFTAICTATSATEANLARYEGDLAAGAAVYAVAMRGDGSSWQPQPCLAITASFVDRHRWLFPTESVAVLNLSGAPDLADWVAALRRANLRHVMAWRKPVGWQRMLAYADDLMQLGMATNRLDGRLLSLRRVPRLRAYGLGETAFYLESRGLAGAADSLLYLQENVPQLFVNTLVPTIDYVTVNEHTLDIELVGQFGRAMPGTPRGPHIAQPVNTEMNAQVIVGTSDAGTWGEPLLARAADALLSGHEALPDPGWPGDLLQTRLQERQLERGGYVQVVNGGRCSNVVPITHWEIPVQVVTTIDGLTLTLTVNVRLRADVHGWRLDPEDAEYNGQPQASLQGSVHSRVDYRASGSAEHYDAPSRTRTTLTWAGSGGAANAIGDFRVFFEAMLLWGSRETFFAQLDVRLAGTYQQRRVVEQFDVNGQLLRRTESTTDEPVALTVAGPGVQGALTLAFDRQWNLQAGQFEQLPVNSDLLPAPPQLVRQTRLSWPQVAPEFAPRDDFGGT